MGSLLIESIPCDSYNANVIKQHREAIMRILLDSSFFDCVGKLIEFGVKE